jgi:hypothetical protein
MGEARPVQAREAHPMERQSQTGTRVGHAQSCTEVRCTVATQHTGYASVTAQMNTGSEYAGNAYHSTIKLEEFTVRCVRIRRREHGHACVTLRALCVLFHARRHRFGVEMERFVNHIRSDFTKRGHTKRQNPP